MVATENEIGGDLDIDALLMSLQLTVEEAFSKAANGQKYAFVGVISKVPPDGGTFDGYEAIFDIPMGATANIPPDQMVTLLVEYVRRSMLAVLKQREAEAGNCPGSGQVQ